MRIIGFESQNTYVSETYIMEALNVKVSLHISQRFYFLVKNKSISYHLSNFFMNNLKARYFLFMKHNEAILDCCYFLKGGAKQSCLSFMITCVH